MRKYVSDFYYKILVHSQFSHTTRVEWFIASEQEKQENLQSRVRRRWSVAVVLQSSQAIAPSADGDRPASRLSSRCPLAGFCLLPIKVHFQTMVALQQQHLVCTCRLLSLLLLQQAQHCCPCPSRGKYAGYQWLVVGQFCGTF